MLTQALKFKLKNCIKQKVKPKAVDLSASLNMLNNPEPVSSEPVKPVEVQTQIQTGAPEVKIEAQKTETPVMSTVKDTQVIFRTTEANKNSLIYEIICVYYPK